MFTFGMGRGETLTRSSSRRDTNTNRHDTNRHDEVDDGSSDDDGEIDAAALAAAAATVVNSINGTPLPAEPDRYDDRYNKRSSRKQLFNDAGDDTNDKASANEFTVRRRDTWWARVRVWRGVYVKVGTRLKTTPEGRITFASPLAELQCEFDEDDDDGTHSRNYWKSPDGRPVTKDEDAVYAESVVSSDDAGAGNRGAGKAKGSERRGQAAPAGGRRAASARDEGGASRATAHGG